jgi:hypothetical protein
MWAKYFLAQAFAAFGGFQAGWAGAESVAGPFFGLSIFKCFHFKCF